jgi:RimJ/RimL family protein N-acetyltransferase
MNWSSALQDAVLENSLVTLRPLQDEDFNDLSEFAYDSRIWRYFVSYVQGEDDLRKLLETAKKDRTEGRRYAFAIVSRQSGRVVGSSAYGNLAEPDRRIEIGWSFLSTKVQGSAVNKSAKALLMQYAFEELGCERVEFKTDVLNEQARGGLRGIGATEEGVLRSFNYMPGGRRRDAVYYSVLRQEWPQVREALRQRLSEPG